METAEILSRLKKAEIPGVLERSRFGRSESVSAWIESKSIAQVAEFLRSDPEIALDWLENLSAMQVDEALVLTYFLRSVAKKHSLILRASIVPPSASGEAEIPSVARIWAMAEPIEAEIGELFGVRFTRSPGWARKASGRLLPEGWVGFPLRKNYVFPKEFGEVKHARAENAARAEGSTRLQRASERKRERKMDQ